MIKAVLKTFVVGGFLYSSYVFADDDYVIYSSVSHNNEVLASPVLIVKPGEAGRIEVEGDNGYVYEAVVMPDEQGTVSTDTMFIYGDYTFGPSFVTYLDEEATFTLENDGDEWSFTVKVSSDHS